MEKNDENGKKFWARWAFQKEEEEIAKNLGVDRSTLQKVRSDFKSIAQKRQKKRK